jgi:hypothetical protein
MATTPPYKVRLSHSNDYDVQVGGVWYTQVIANAQGRKLPDAAITKMAHWLESNTSDHGSSDEWLKIGYFANHPVPDSRESLKEIIASGYVQKAIPDTRTPYPVPGLPHLPGNPLTGIEDTFGLLKSIVEKLFDPKFWLRVLELGIGAILLGVGLSHLSENADSAIKTIPGYGKVVNRAMHPAPRRAYQGSHAA